MAEDNELLKKLQKQVSGLETQLQGQDAGDVLNKEISEAEQREQLLKQMLALGDGGALQKMIAQAMGQSWYSGLQPGAASTTTKPSPPSERPGPYEIGTGLGNKAGSGPTGQTSDFTTPQGGYGGGGSKSGGGGDFGGGGSSGSWEQQTGARARTPFHDTHMWPDSAGRGRTPWHSTHPGISSGAYPMEGGTVGGSGTMGQGYGWWTPERQQHAVSYLMQHAGLTEMGAKGLVSRWAYVEATKGPGEVNRIGATGIAQWLGARKAGVVPGDFEGQLAHAAKELRSSESRAGDVLRSAKTPDEAARGASMYERAEGYSSRTGRDNFTGRTAQMIPRISGGVSAPSSEYQQSGGKGGGFGAQRIPTEGTTDSISQYGVGVIGGKQAYSPQQLAQRPMHQEGTLSFQGFEGIKTQVQFGSGRDDIRKFYGVPYGTYSLEPQHIAGRMAGFYQKYGTSPTGPYSEVVNVGKPGDPIHTGFDPAVGRGRGEIQIHAQPANINELWSQGCLAIPAKQFPAFREAFDKAWKQTNGQIALEVTAEGARIVPKHGKGISADQAIQNKQSTGTVSSSQSEEPPSKPKMAPGKTGKIDKEITPTKTATEISSNKFGASLILASEVKPYTEKITHLPSTGPVTTDDIKKDLERQNKITQQGLQQRELELQEPPKAGAAQRFTDRRLTDKVLGPPKAEENIPGHYPLKNYPTSKAVGAEGRGHTPLPIWAKNPGAMWPGPSASRFGSTTHFNIPDRQHNKIAIFPSHELGAAAQFDLWARKYSGMTVGQAIKKWSGHNSSSAYAKSLGVSLDRKITRQWLAGPEGLQFMIKQSRWEAGAHYPLDDAGFARAQKIAFGDGTAESGKGGGQENRPQPKEHTGTSEGAGDHYTGSRILPGHTLTGVNPELRARLQSMYEHAPTSAHQGFRVVSGLRSTALQAQLYHRYKTGRGGIAAPPGHSQHEHGMAIDLHDPSGWFHQHAHEYGLTFPMGKKDWPHMQMDPSWKGKSFAAHHEEPAPQATPHPQTPSAPEPKDQSRLQPGLGWTTPIYRAQNTRIQNSAAQHNALQPHQHAAPPPHDTANKQLTPQTTHKTIQQNAPERRNTNQTQNWTSHSASTAASSRVEHHYARRRADESFTTASQPNS